MANQIDHILEDLERSTKLTEGLQEDVQAMAISMAELVVRMELMETSLRSLLETVRDGDRPMMVRLATLEADLITTKNTMENISNKINNDTEAKIKYNEEEKKNQIRGKWQIQAALIAGVLGLISSLVSVFYK